MRDYSKHTDKELVTLIASSDERAFEQLYDRFWERLLYFARQKTGDLMDAENAVQDVFISLWNRRTNLELTSDLSGYLMVSVKYRIIRLFEKQKSQRRLEEKNAAFYDLLDNSTQEYIELEELRAQLEEHICKLPEKSRIIFRMNKQQGMSHKQIGEELGITEQAVNAHLVRTKKSLLVSLRSFLHSYLL
ncbi:MAG: sigma-70 family RNA polymerase sigma factor [Bacteroidota bacterium]